MPFSNNSILQVLFMLSTIVTLTDCCSSRILLMKERSLNVVQQQQQQQQQLYPELQQHQLSSATTQQSHIIQLPIYASDIELAPPVIPPNVQQPDVNHTLELMTQESIKTDDLYDVLENTEAEMITETTVTTLSAIDDDETSSSSTIAVSESIVRDNITPKSKSRHGGYVLDIYFNMMREMLSIECTGEFGKAFCLNSGRCFQYAFGNLSLHSCECADGFMGERCELKISSGLFIISGREPTISMARVVFSYQMLIVIPFIYLIWYIMCELLILRRWLPPRQAHDRNQQSQHQHRYYDNQRKDLKQEIIFEDHRMQAAGMLAFYV